MLVEKSVYEEGEIVVLKLNCGDEIVTKILSHDPTRYTIRVKQPLQVQIMRGSDGQPAKALMPWLMLNPEGNPTIELSSVVAVVSAPKEVQDAWTTETSGIILAR